MPLRFAPVAALLLTIQIAAQLPSAWSELKVPGGVQIANIQQRGKILIYRVGNTVHAYSGLTRSWHTLAASSQASIRIANDLVLVEDGTRFSAFASYTGRFVSVTLSTAAAVVNPKSQRNDSIMLVRDGFNLWSFSGFLGTWTKRVIAASARVAVQRNVAIVAEGRQLAGMSAFRGKWITMTILGPVSMVTADGSVGIVQVGSRIHGFSALRSSWQSSTALPGTTNFALEDDLAVWWNGLSYLGFSGLRGTFASVVTGIALKVVVSEQVVVAHQGNQFWCYSATTGTWTRVQTTGTPQLSVQSSHALMIDASEVYTFSGPRGQSAAIAIRATRFAASSAVAVVMNATGGALFSALTARWTRLPSRAMTDLPQVASTGALVRTTTGYTAYSARTGRFYDLTATGNARTHSNPSSAILAVEDGKRLAVFEPRRQTWLTTSVRGTSPLNVALWRTSMTAFDSETAFGFGAFHGRIEGVKLNGTFREVHSSSESGRGVTGTSIAVFSAVPLLSTPWQYPEFRRTFVGGSDLDLYLSAASSTGQAYLALGVQSPFVLPGLGAVLLDGAQLLPVTLPLDARTGTARTSISVPDLPGLRGLELFMQALVVPTTGSPYVTDLASVLLY